MLTSFRLCLESYHKNLPLNGVPPLQISKAKHESKRKYLINPTPDTIIPTPCQLTSQALLCLDSDALISF